MDDGLALEGGDFVLDGVFLRPVVAVVIEDDSPLYQLLVGALSLDRSARAQNEDLIRAREEKIKLSIE